MPNNDQIKDVTVIIGGEEIAREILPLINEDGTPVLYPVTIKGFKQKPGRPNDQGQETIYYSWTFEIIEGDKKGTTLFGSTNDQARRSWTTKKPMKLLQLVMALNGGKEPAKGTGLNLSDLIGLKLKVELEDAKGADGEAFQRVCRFYSAGTKQQIDEL